MTYEQALAAIAALQPRGWRLGLDRMNEFVRRAGLVETVDGSTIRYVHVAGTNGKGSTTAYLQSILVESGVRTGAFFSPFVFDPRERVQFGREMIPAQELADLTEELLQVADGMDATEFAGVTEFELKTGIGFLHWKRRAAEWVALETGLGGRLDATNVVTPAASIISSIGLDHQAILGDTREKIAFEKAGIVKPGKPVVVGQMSDEAFAVIDRVAREVEAPLWRYGSDVRWEPKSNSVVTPNAEYRGLQPGIPGVWQPHNLALAVAALDAVHGPHTAESVAQGALKASVPGRYQTIPFGGRRFILDGAHNPDSANALAQTLDLDLSEDEQVILITNMLHGHEPKEFYEVLAHRVRKAIVAPIDFHRARTPEETVAELKALGIDAAPVASAHEAVSAALKEARPAEKILVTGSFYLLGQVGPSIGLGISTSTAAQR